MGNYKMCDILVVERNGPKFGPRGLIFSVCVVLTFDS